MSEGESGDKKFEISGKRREELRQKGNIPRSQDITTAAILMAGCGALVIGGGALVGLLKEAMKNAFSQIAQPHLNVSFQTMGPIFSMNLGIWMALFLGMLAFVVFVSQVMQTGLLFVEDAVSLNFDRVNPLEGFKKLFTFTKIVQAGQSFVKLGVIIGFGYQAVEGLQNEAVFARPLNLAELQTVYSDAAWLLGGRVAMALAVLAAIDYGYQFWKFNQDHKMTEQEVRDERKGYESSPEVAKKRKMMARKLSARRMVENVKDATIVITNPTHYAVALRYKRGETEAPIVVAKGSNRTAMRMKERAFELRISVREDRPLAQGLYKYSAVNKPIPQIFYQGVAIVLASLYKQGFLASDPRNDKSKVSDAEKQEND